MYSEQNFKKKKFFLVNRICTLTNGKNQKDDRQLITSVILIFPILTQVISFFQGQPLLLQLHATYEID